MHETKMQTRVSVLLWKKEKQFGRTNKAFMKICTERRN